MKMFRQLPPLNEGNGLGLETIRGVCITECCNRECSYSDVNSSCGLVPQEFDAVTLSVPLNAERLKSMVTEFPIPLIVDQFRKVQLYVLPRNIWNCINNPAGTLAYRCRGRE